MLDTSLNIKTNHFDGPLSLLLFLIKKNEMNLDELDINHLTEYYLNYLIKMEKLNFDIAGNYLYMATSLLLMKSSRCLMEPQVVEEIIEAQAEVISEETLIRRLKLLEIYQNKGKEMSLWPRKNRNFFTRAPLKRKKVIDGMLVPIDNQRLILSMVKTLEKNKRQYRVVKTDQISIREKLQSLTTLLKNGQSISFEELLKLEGNKNLKNKVVTFISLLELARMKKAYIYQAQDKQSIYVDILEEPSQWNLDKQIFIDTEKQNEENHGQQI